MLGDKRREGKGKEAKEEALDPSVNHDEEHPVDAMVEPAEIKKEIMEDYLL